MKILCTLIGHQRSGKHARPRGDEWHSYCRRCGVPMRRDGPGKWSVFDRTEDPDRLWVPRPESKEGDESKEG